MDGFSDCTAYHRLWCLVNPETLPELDFDKLRELEEAFTKELAAQKRAFAWKNHGRKVYGEEKERQLCQLQAARDAGEDRDCCGRNRAEDRRARGVFDSPAFRPDGAGEFFGAAACCSR